jgi:hypothetical protein
VHTTYARLALTQKVEVKILLNLIDPEDGDTILSLNVGVTRHNTPIHNILSTTPQLSISQKALGTLPEDGNVMPKHVGATIRN